MKWSSVCFLLFIVTAAASCAVPDEPRADTSEADVAAIHAMTVRWSDAVVASDVDGVVACYTDDAVRMPPNAESYAGVEAIRGVFEGYFEEYSMEMNWPTKDEEIVVAEGWAFHSDNYTARMIPLAEGEAVGLDGKVIVLFQRQPDGSWKVAREIWNDNAPPPEK